MTRHRVHSPTSRHAPPLLHALLPLLALLAAACSAPHTLAPPPELLAPRLEAERQLLHLTARHQDDHTIALELRTELHLQRRPAPFDHLVLWLHPDAVVDTLELDGRPTTFRTSDLTHTHFEHASAWRIDLGAGDAPPNVIAVRSRLVLGPPTAPRASSSWYEQGVLQLAEADAWYPRLATGMPSVSVELDLPDDLEPCAEGTRIDLGASAPGRHTVRFESATPSHGLTLAAGRWQRTERRVAGEVTLRVLLAPHQPEGLDGVILDIAEDALKHFTGWLGAYPFASFTVAEVPAGAMLAFPGYALLDPAHLADRQGLRTGLPHELLHAWLGHQVLLGPGGNWIEGLTTYLAEHEHYASASSDHARTLRKRLLRDHLASVSGLTDLPVNAFRRGFGHASQSIGYAKVAMIFHMLRDQLGDAAFYGGLRELVRRYRFEPASWEDVLVIFEEVSGQGLARFSVEWLERTGAPRLSLAAAHNEGPVHASAAAATAPHALTLEVVQGDPPYQLRVPVLIELAGGERYRTHVALAAERSSTVRLEVPARPRRVVLDPDYELFRALNADEVEPTLRETFTASGAAPEPASLAVVAGERFLARHEDEVELAVAARLAARFERVEAEEALADDGAALLVVPRASLAGLADALELPPDIVWGDDGQPQRLADQPLTDGHSLAFATRTRSGAPRVVVALAEEADLARVLLTLERFVAWSHVIYDGGEPVRRGMWKQHAVSMARDL